MDYEEELEALQNEALAEIEENDDTDADNNQREESDDDTDDYGEAEEDRQGTSGDEEEDDYENDDEKLDENEDENEEGEDYDKEDDETNHESDKDEKDNSTFEPIEVEVNGQTITLESNDEVKAYLKNSNQKPSRKRKSQNERTLEQGGVTSADLALLIDAKNGDKAALAKLAQQSKIDIYDIDEDLADSYKPTFSPTIMTEVDEVAEDIMSNEKLYSDFKEVVTTVPEEFVAAISTDAKALKNFASHIESGLAQKVIPMAMKAKLLKGGDFLSHYAEIGRKVAAEGKGEKPKPTDSKSKRSKDPRADKLRERANNKKGSNKGTKTITTGEDIWAMSEKEFAKKYL